MSEATEFYKMGQHFSHAGRTKRGVSAKRKCYGKKKVDTLRFVHPTRIYILDLKNWSKPIMVAD